MNKKGFTLMELLVVISILGFVATLATASLSTARAKGRDARRIIEVKAFQKALELYYIDHDEYPDQSVFYTLAFSRSRFPANADVEPRFIYEELLCDALNDGCHDEGGSTDDDIWELFYEKYLEEYISHIPRDPSGPGWPNIFYYKRGNSAVGEALHCGPINGRINGYTILFYSEATKYNLRQAFDTLPSVADKRYCLHPD